MTNTEKLKAFAAIQQNKDVMLLAMQGLDDRQIAANLRLGRGTVTTIVSQANELLGNGGGISIHALGATLRGMKKP